MLAGSGIVAPPLGGVPLFQLTRTMFRSSTPTKPSPVGSPAKRSPGVTFWFQLIRTMFRSSTPTKPSALRSPASPAKNRSRCWRCTAHPARCRGSWVTARVSNVPVSVPPVFRIGNESPMLGVNALNSVMSSVVPGVDCRVITDQQLVEFGARGQATKFDGEAPVVHDVVASNARCSR